MQITPPSTAVTTLVGLSEKTSHVPKVPAFRPRYSAPSPWALSKSTVSHRDRSRRGAGRCPAGLRRRKRGRWLPCAATGSARRPRDPMSAIPGGIRRKGTSRSTPNAWAVAATVLDWRDDLGPGPQLHRLYGQHRPPRAGRPAITWVAPVRRQTYYSKARTIGPVVTSPSFQPGRTSASNSRNIGGSAG